MNKNKMIGIAAIASAFVVLIICIANCGGTPPGEERCKAIAARIDSAYRLHHDAKALKMVDVWLENSASMDGYYHEYTSYFATIDAYLRAKRTLVPATRDSLTIVCGDSLTPFINTESHKLTRLWQPQTAEYRSERYGARSTTHLSAIIGKMLRQNKCGTVSVLFSDFILSPGSSNAKEIENYLADATGTIQTAVEQVRKGGRKDFCVVLRSYTSSFSGQYYFVSDEHMFHTGTRPFYALIAGGYGEVRAFLAELDSKYKADSGSKKPEQVLLCLGLQDDIPYALRGISPEACPCGKIHRAVSEEDIEAAASGECPLTIQMNVDLSCLPYDEAFMKNAQNWCVTPLNGGKPYFTVKEVKRAEAPNGPFTHTVVMRCEGVNIVSQKEFSAVLRRPDSKDGLKAIACTARDNSIEKGKVPEGTFGIDHIAHAVKAAYADNGTEAARFTFRIN